LQDKSTGIVADSFLGGWDIGIVRLFFWHSTGCLGRGKTTFSA